MKRRIVLLVGKSGSGKTTIANECEKSYGLKSIQSYTTRPPRYEGETGHLFVCKQKFDSLPDKVAYTLYNGYEYCATAAQVEENDLYVIDPKGVNEFMRRYNGGKEVCIIYVVADLDPRIAFDIYYERMRRRGDTAKAAADRVALDNHEFKGFEAKADYVFVNGRKEDIDSICNAIAFLAKGASFDDKNDSVGADN